MASRTSPYTESAYDLESLVRAVHPPADRVSLLGISYGTYLALRYRTFSPTGRVDAVTLDSLCSPGKCKLSEQDMWEDEVAHQLLDLCAGDPDCSRYYPPDGDSAWQSLGELYKAIEGGHCPLTEDPALDVELLRAHLGMLNFNYGGRRLVPALIRRYHRCAPEDVEAIRHNYVTNLGFDPTAFAAMPLPQLAYQAQALQGYSFPLAINILVSELRRRATRAPTSSSRGGRRRVRAAACPVTRPSRPPAGRATTSRGRTSGPTSASRSWR